MTSWDAVVVGAGPAGSSAAAELARAGLRVALFDKQRLPRYKTCGGGLLQRTLRALPKGWEPTVERECFQAQLVHHDPALSYSTFRDKPIVSMVMRDAFDWAGARCAEACGANLRLGETLRAVEVQDSRVVLCTDHETLGASFFIAADGVMSWTARQLRYPELRDVVPALEVEIEVDSNRFDAAATSARFDFGLISSGYGWVFPKKNHLSVGVLTTERGSCNLHRAYEHYLKAVSLTQPDAESRHGYMIPLRPRAKMFRQPRVLFAGDAAGLADPVTAEGISSAIRSGRWAAEAIIGAGLDPVDAIRHYRMRLESEILSELRCARILARLLYRCPRLRRWALRRGGQGLAEFVTDVTLGHTTYRAGIGRPRNWLKFLAGWS